MTQQELADAIDVTRQTVVAIEGDEFRHHWRRPFELQRALLVRWKPSFNTAHQLRQDESAKAGLHFACRLCGTNAAKI